jgi:hypothetical protein
MISPSPILSPRCLRIARVLLSVVPAKRGLWQFARCGLAFLLPSVAFAVMPPWVYERARETAMQHLQVRVLRVVGPPETPGECRVTGEVARIFRDRSAVVTLGTPLDFTVSCSKPGDTVPIGGTLWTDYEELVLAKYLEVFLDSDESGYHVALWQSRIIETPTEGPTFAPTKKATP